MNRIPLIQTESASPDRQALLQSVHKAFGATPNMFRAVANSPAALQAMWGSFGALGKGKLGARLGEQIAVAIANENRCDYCLAAHTYIGQGAGLSADTLAQAQVGESSDPKTAEALRFALKLTRERGQVTDADVGALRQVGFTDEQIVEILAHVALNVFTNYTNIAFGVPVDFPVVALRHAA
ncbi:carboxymuconolactone decarboxylase [Ahniella affigens]|uniref:Carboxymuconolactone decarboxylase n=1 Tax=Ahniella affigens TaxID=2021234 RepID=A0A2P1PQE2_9GAMM|nr:peroxidase-related enzyme [Ahniella affigens]AVP97061.1 carboxymuconolactone decarboxylase [Ahniella affigens]